MLKASFVPFQYLWTAIAEDWRGKLVLGTAVAAGLVTVILFFVPNATDVTGFFGAAFAGWVAAFVLFVITGLVAAIVTLVRPDQELFESRMRNLLQRQEGPHIDYLLSQSAHLFEPYVDDSSRVITVMDFDEATQRFLVSQETDFTFRSYLPDIPMSFRSTVGYVNAAEAPPGKQPCCLSYLRVNGDDVGAEEEFVGQITRDFEVKVAPKSTCNVHHRMVYWMAAQDEPNRQRVRRFTRKMTVSVNNQLATRAIRVTKPAQTGASILVKAGATAQVVNLVERSPGEHQEDFAFDFRLSPD